MASPQPITPDQALTGTAAQFEQYFDQLHRTYFPGVPYGGQVDVTLMSTPEGKKALEDKFRQLYERFPTNDPKYNLSAMPDIPQQASDAFNGMVFGWLLRDMFMLHKDPTVFPGTNAYATDLRPTKILPQTSVMALGLTSCDHCLSPAEKVMRNMSCDSADPIKARQSQLSRMATSLHEFAHNMTSDGQSSAGTVAGKRDGRDVLLDKENYNESLADGFMTLMMRKNYGAEGHATTLGWLHDRHDSNMKGSHHTLATVRALMQMVDADPKLLEQTPDKLLALAISTAQKNALTPDEVASFNAYKAADTYARPAPESLPAHIRDYLASKAEIQPRVEEIRATLVDLNPLRRDPLWQQKADAAAQECRALMGGPKKPAP